MKCPKDVDEDDFEDMMKSVPKGCRLIRTEIPHSERYPDCWRDFIFKVERPFREFQKGDTLAFSCARKFAA